MADGIQRRLTTIVAADIAGFSRLVGVDEEGTLAAQRSHRNELIEPLLAEHHGRIANTAGDSYLFEFPSAVEAVRCSMAVQDGIAKRNRDIPTDRRIEYRIGINVGDVMAEGDDLLGDGVNVAARLEGLSEPGSIRLSRAARDQIRDRMDINLEDMGEVEVKNIARPVRVFRISGEADVTNLPATKPTNRKQPLPDKPSIAILPFYNMSGDPDQEYFTDGLTEDIITLLSKLRWLFVIARNSSFQYKGQSPDIREVADSLGVRYVLEGSVRKAGGRIRVTAQLIDAISGSHIWADRFDRNLIDIFDLQDQLTQAIAANVDQELAANEQEQSRRKPTDDMDAWDNWLRGMWHIQRFDTQEILAARPWLLSAIEKDSDFAAPYGALGFLATLEVMYGHTEDQDATLQEGLRHAERSVALDVQDPYNHYALGRVCIFRGDSQRAIVACQKAIELNPSFSSGHFGLGNALYWFGQAEAALPHFEMVLRLNPRDPGNWGIYNYIGSCYFVLGNFEQSIENSRRACELRGTEFWPHLTMARNFGYFDHIEEARTSLAEALRLKPDLTIKSYSALNPNAHPVYKDMALIGLRKAGLPEE